MPISPESGIGPRVRAARNRLGWSREVLAFHSGISWSGIAQVESGRRTNIRPGTLSALARALGVTVDYLVSGGPASEPMLEHSALLYRTEEELLETAVPFLVAGVERSEGVLALTTRAHIDLLRDRLGAAARQVDLVESSTLLTTPDATLDSFTAFARAKLDAGVPWIRILGEPLWEGRTETEVEDWTRFESLLNLVFAAWPMTILCPYDVRSVSPEVARHARATHPRMIGAEGITSSAEYAAPGGFVLRR
jgi:transcriptional regulator with XRE-family HTH domain